MEPKLAFWTFALVNLFAVVLCALLGVRQIRRGRVRSHQRLMVTAGSLVVVFLLAYVVKVLVLGREALGSWSAGDRAVLYIHELCVASMLLGGGYALWKALGFRGSLPLDAPLIREQEPGSGRVAHRRAGRVAVIGSLLGFFTAIAVLAGMYARA